MTDAFPRSRGIRATLQSVLQHPIVLWVAFVAAHFVLGLLGLFGPGWPLGDVSQTYRFWVTTGLDSGIWVGIDTVWVYPIVALVPMLAAHLFGPDQFTPTWLTEVMIVDAVAFLVIVSFHRDRRLTTVGWWWLGFLLLLGPVAVGRVDSITVPVAIVGVLLLAARPALAAVLLSVATWIKVWPAALIAAAIVTMRERWRVLAGAAAASIVIAVVALLLGAGGNLFSFIGQQAGRGLQVESPIGTFWMWDAWATQSSRSIVYYDQAILTYQVVGPGAVTAAAIVTPVLAVVTAALLVLGFVAMRRGVPAAELLPPLTLAITTALILFNKVGSPQFVTWLAVPIVLGLTASVTGHGASFRVPAILGLVIAGLTQLIYPYLYDQLIGLNFTMLLILSARNVLYVALLLWAIVAVVDAVRFEPEVTPRRQSVAAT
ncbi:MAG: hypothetical protein AB7K08_01510 [Microbacteriaceae bacterium]